MIAHQMLGTHVFGVINSMLFLWDRIPHLDKVHVKPHMLIHTSVSESNISNVVFVMCAASA